MVKDNELHIIKQGCFHHYALDNRGEKINIESVRKENKHNGFHCVSCGDEMIPVLGKIRAHHFRHKTNACSYESYIHKLWKQFIFEQWYKLPHFYVTYYVEYRCDKTDRCKLHAANKMLRCGSIVKQETIDLKEKYDTCEIEGVYGGYRADILLSNSHTPDVTPTFIEICYKHPCDERKQYAGIPIVELKVTDDNLRLPQQPTEAPTLIPGLGNCSAGDLGIILYGFDRKRQISHTVRRFTCYQDENGINHGKIDKKVLSCHRIDEHLSDSMLEIFVEDNAALNNSSFFEFGIRMAAKNGIKIRHCIWCRFRGSRDNTCKIRIKSDKKSWLVNINDFSDIEFDKTNYSSKCRSFKGYPLKPDLNNNKLACVVWKNDSYVHKPEKRQTNVININEINDQHLNKIALEHTKN